jgi:alkyl sulfatase BDS1-like metallo-beta-lactamase superfamily hydrolase
MTPADATAHTRAVTGAPAPDMDPNDVDRARRGLIARHPTGRIDGEWGVAWDWSRYEFLADDGPNPDTVHPSLWRQARLNAEHGLFEVADGLWQVRGYDISNVTFVAGETGWIVIDPLTSRSTARAALDLADTHLGARPVVAVIYTHSHADHFGGVEGVTTVQDVAAGRCRVIAPVGFLHEAISENVIAGFAMTRRALYQFGPLLPPGPRGHVDCGLGKAIPIEAPGLIAPTEEITATGQELVVDGVRIVFQLTPEAEAPAEMNFFFPDRGWLCTAENCTHNMHNLVPIRGAQVRDALAWSRYIDEALRLFGAEVRLSFASHHWPRWGHEDVVGYLRLQRDMYRWIHDQTMRLANHGETPLEIAEALSLPPEFAAESHTTGYYGHLAHNVKAVYQRYLSWYDGNPANLWRLPPSDVGRRYVDLAGGPEALLASARVAHEAGDYRWVVELVNHLVFADPTNTAARELQAAALEQLGYQSESATFRNAFLTGAQELRHGTLPRRDAMRRGYLNAMTIGQLLDATAVRLRSEDVGGLRLLIHLRFGALDGVDPTDDWTLELSNRTLHHRAGLDGTPDAVVSLDRVVLERLAANDIDLREAIASGEVAVIGDREALPTIVDHLDTFRSGFPIVEP